jgi:hypothetical protein
LCGSHFLSGIALLLEAASPYSFGVAAFRALPVPTAPDLCASITRGVVHDHNNTAAQIPPSECLRIASKLWPDSGPKTGSSWSRVENPSSPLAQRIHVPSTYGTPPLVLSLVPVDRPLPPLLKSLVFVDLADSVYSPKRLKEDSPLIEYSTWHVSSRTSSTSPSDLP